MSIFDQSEYIVYLGLNPNDQKQVLGNLSTAYFKNYIEPDDEGMLAGVDHNHMAVAMALRCHLLPGQLVAELHDVHIPKEVLTLDIFPDREKVQSTKKAFYEGNDSTRREILLAVDKRLGYSWSNGERTYFGGEGHAPGVYGYALDMPTGVEVVTGHGRHFSPESELEPKLAERGIRNVSLNDAEDRFICGLLVCDVSGLDIPVLVINDIFLGESKAQAKLDYALKKSRFLPILSKYKTRALLGIK